MDCKLVIGKEIKSGSKCSLLGMGRCVKRSSTRLSAGPTAICYITFFNLPRPATAAATATA